MEDAMEIEMFEFNTATTKTQEDDLYDMFLQKSLTKRKSIRLADIPVVAQAEVDRQKENENDDAMEK